MIVHEGHESTVFSVAFSPNGKSVASGSNDETIRIWDAKNPSPIGEPLRGHNDSIESVSYSPLGNTIASGSNDETIRLWDVNAAQQMGEPLKGSHLFHCVAFSPDAKLIASGCGGDLFDPDPTAFSVQLWDVQEMKLAANLLKGHTDVVRSVDFSPDGTRVVSSSNDGSIHVWDVEHRKPTVAPLKVHTDWVRSAVFSPDGSQIASCSFDCTVRLWDARGGTTTGNPYKGHTNWVHSVAWSPCGLYVVSGGEDNTVRVWDVRTSRQVQLFEEHTSWVSSVAVSPCGHYIASGSADRKVIIRKISGEDPDSACSARSQVITSQMSTRQMFDCLTSTGCIDLTSQMDARQETAMIMSGGGFGDIWMGKLHNGEKVAIKAWRTNTLGRCEYKTLKRAARELFCWSRMEHPNVHRLQGVILFRDQYLGMVSEWMEQGNLHEYLRTCPSADRYELCVHIASGLDYMHRQNTINVLVSSDGVAKLSDFDFSIMSGVSSLVFSESSNSRSGSLRWAAPEMLLEDVPKRTTQSDVYALGMTMLEIFTGEVPYPECRHDYTILKKVERGILPTRPLVQLMDEEKGNMMWNLLLNCWRKNAIERPSSERVLDTLIFHIYQA
ncbi:tyrosine kinase family catalytic domain protein [Rhizoctonia solani AG-3 Rhs1AP]|uniref:Tyrosine kinase family catalytic domain protein n=1 Tax=Rhizoctonia solani AG-3 Rhs1AP TaxID=1086054 RepID=A0A0A1UJJ2_9AGAM|nr:tyrosine kinase family catalytic domain protein [Rhizoctonia solani AG-3 Rhs1AP]